MANTWTKKFSRAQLAMALKVVKAFKEAETPEEWAFTPFANWQKLESMERDITVAVASKPRKTARG